MPKAVSDIIPTMKTGRSRRALRIALLSNQLERLAASYFGD
jgi:hypothetical protein